jgi:hypothetical protein
VGDAIVGDAYITQRFYPAGSQTQITIVIVVHHLIRPFGLLPKPARFTRRPLDADNSPATLADVLGDATAIPLVYQMPEGDCC